MRIQLRHKNKGYTIVETRILKINFYNNGIDIVFLNGLFQFYSYDEYDIIEITKGGE